MTRRVFEKLCTKKVCVDFLAPKYRQRKFVFELIMPFVADTDTDENDLGINFLSRCRDSCSLLLGGGQHSR